jgi:hypothetical protein
MRQGNILNEATAVSLATFPGEVIRASILIVVLHQLFPVDVLAFASEKDPRPARILLFGDSATKQILSIYTVGRATELRISLLTAVPVCPEPTFFYAAFCRLTPRHGQSFSPLRQSSSTSLRMRSPLTNSSLVSSENRTSRSGSLDSTTDQENGNQPPPTSSGRYLNDYLAYCCRNPNLYRPEQKSPTLPWRSSRPCNEPREV